jgi:hypothetical protein
MAEPTFAEQMVARYEVLLLKCAGLTSIAVDGFSTSYADLEAKHRYWKTRVAREQGTRPVALSVNLDTAGG